MNKRIVGILILVVTIAGMGFKLNLISMGGGASGAGGAAAAAVADWEVADFSLGERPSIIQEAVNKNFNKLVSRKRAQLLPSGDLGEGESWGYTGDEGFYYRNMKIGIDEAKVIKDIATKPKENIYLMDVGAGEGAWCSAAIRYIQENLKESKKHFHIICVTGESELSTKTSHVAKNITLYEFGKFSIENIIAEFKKHQLDLVNKIDLMLCKHTLQHLVDPVGTLKQLYSLLAPDNGILLATGWALYINDGDQRIDNSFYGLWEDETYPKKYYLFMIEEGRTFEFLLIKRDNRPLEPQLKYQSKLMVVDESIRQLGHGWAEKVAIYRSPIKNLPESTLKYNRLNKKWRRLSDLDPSYSDFNVFYRAIEDPQDIKALMEKEWAKGMVSY